ncbi:chondroitin AC/alginate lyase [Mycena belliarum]|uniref:Chondroitin AC/alginate lyase n=1 Tax=Mycena belliarum TaxID=1033014 RepID=A0AAD6UMP0_9AGAR|nr:chondroitin AC/alginate lyase [Mycena belliae]
MPVSPYFLLLALLASPAVADPTDWVAIAYVSKASQSLGRSTDDARNTIIQSARSSAKSGPWSVTDANGVLPPSRNPRDYLSWAPYHWPDCNWCTNSHQRVHLVHDGGGDNNGTASDAGDDNSGYEEEAVPHPVSSAAYRRMIRRRRSAAEIVAAEPSEPIADAPGPQAPLGELPSLVPVSSLTSPTTPSTTTATAVAGSSAAPQAAGKTKSPSCTPSPTKSMAPSATWTTCPYVVRDGKVNPDVRTLNGPAAINRASQSILYNAVCFALKGPSAGVCSQNTVTFIDTFFLDPKTGMNPNMNFGQVVRGPGASGREGTFTGVLDLRGTVKVVNAIELIKAGGSPDWTSGKDAAMGKWLANYTNWLMNSDLGKSTAAKANNHASFYVAQLAATKMGLGDDAGARETLKDFFQKQFMNQIAASGEQPLEAVRTRPWHYRWFNLEALIASTRLENSRCDELGMNLWTKETRYKSTIKTACDFAMKLDPKGEDVTEALPHVAAIAAVYGDPTGKYAAFLQKTMSNYRTKPFFFYDQPEAFSATSKNKRDRRLVATAIPFDCPADELLADGEKCVQLDDGICAACTELEPLYTGVENVV